MDSSTRPIPRTPTRLIGCSKGARNMRYFSELHPKLHPVRIMSVGDCSQIALGSGADGGARTHNLRFRRPLLYPLSYARIALTIAYARPADKPLCGIRTIHNIRPESP